MDKTITAICTYTYSDEPVTMVFTGDDNLLQLYHQLKEVDNIDELKTIKISGNGQGSAYNEVTDEGLLDGAENLISVDLTELNTSNVTNMSSMFYYCSSLTELDLSSFDTSNVTDMIYMFAGCSNLTSLDLSSWNTSNVTTVVRMFMDCSNLTTLNLSNWNTSNITDMGWMFYGCSNLTELDLRSFDTTRVNDTSHMFYNCSKLKTIYNNNDWDSPPNINSSAEMFKNCFELSGAIAYNQNRVDITKANPKTGYFTNSIATKVTFRRKKTAEIDNLPIRDGQLIYDTETGKTYLDNGNQRIATGRESGDTVPIGAIIEYDGSTVPEGYEEVEPSICRMVTNNIQTFTQNVEQVTVWSSDYGFEYGDYKIDPSNNRLIIKNTTICEITGGWGGDDYAWARLNIIDGDTVVENFPVLVQATGNGYWFSPLQTALIELDPTKTYYITMTIAAYNVNSFTLNGGFGHSATWIGAKKIK